MRKQILLMTRPLQAGRSFVARLDPALMRGVDVIYAPLIQIVPRGPCPDLAPYEGVVFTSANGVDFAPIGNGMSAYCVGRRTAEHASQKGYEVRATALDADDLVQQIDASRCAAPLVHLAGAFTRGDIAARLTALGIPTTAHVTYDQPLQPLDAVAHAALTGEVPVILPLFSPRTAAHLVHQTDGAPSTTAIALSRAVADHLEPKRFAEVLITAQPTGKDMVQYVEKLLRHNSLS